MNCYIRAATPEDIDAMHAIRLAVRENPFSKASGITTHTYEPYVSSASAWVAERNHAIVGFAAVDEANAEVWALFVAASDEMTGVGRALHDAILGWATGRGLVQLELATTPNTRAEGFYKKLGWRPVGYDVHGQILFRLSISR